MNEQQIEALLKQLPPELLEKLQRKAINAMAEIDNWNDIIEMFLNATAAIVKALPDEVEHETKVKIMIPMTMIASLQKTAGLEPKTNDAYIFINRFSTIFEPAFNALLHGTVEDIRKVLPR